MVFSVENPSHPYGDHSNSPRSIAPPRINEAISKFTQPHAVIFDYDDVLSPEGVSPAVRLVEAYRDAGHIDEEAWNRFSNVLENGEEYGDREAEGELLSIATTGLEGEEKKEVYGTTSDFVTENYDDLLRKDADQLLEDLEAPIIVSNNYRMFFEALADHSNVVENNVYANKLSVDGDGFLDGDLEFNLFKAGKGTVAREVGKNYYIKAAVGNSVSDFPLLRVAERAYGINPTDEFREKAHPDWRVVDSLEEVEEELNKDKGFLKTFF